jgi:hypothetical protein
VIGVMAIMSGTIEVSVLAPTPALRMSALERPIAWWGTSPKPDGRFDRYALLGASNEVRLCPLKPFFALGH